MTIKQAFAKYKGVETDILLSEVLKKPREFLYLAPEHKLSSYQVKSLSSMVRRRLKGEPIAYILGYKDFMGLRFKLNKHTLIPRPETEEMVERVTSDGLRVTGNTLKILDVGTGTGCIAISLAKYLKISNIRYQISASDISSQALKVAKENAKAHNVSVQFVLSDLLDNIKGNFDIIIANLPYVPTSDYKKLKSNLKFEPKNAIFAKENGLEIIAKLLSQVAYLKHQPAIVYLEFDPRQKVPLSKLIKKTLPFYKAEFFKDLNNIWRYCEIIKQNHS